MLAQKRDKLKRYQMTNKNLDLDEKERAAIMKSTVVQKKAPTP